MSTIGIIAEFNPLHKGHEFLIEQAKNMGTVVCVMSGNFVQRGDIAIYPKEIRTKAALLCGCDLVAELPTHWAMSTAQNFAIGSVFILNCLGCDTIMFGSECGETEPLIKIADILESEEFKTALSDELKAGITFAKARENAVKKCGGDFTLLLGANNNLAIEYIIAARQINKAIRFVTVKRVGSQHDSMNETDFVSATLLREKIKANNLSFLEAHTPKKAFELYKNSPFADICGKDNAILSVLRTRTLSELEVLPDISEGIENKIFSAIRLAVSLDELYNNIKVKRYTLARIRRLVLNAFLGIDNKSFMKLPPYIRIIGMNNSGERVIKSATADSSVPIVISSSQIQKLSSEAKKIFFDEARASDLYNLFLSAPRVCGDEYTRKIIKTE